MNVIKHKNTIFMFLSEVFGGRKDYEIKEKTCIVIGYDFDPIFDGSLRRKER